MRKVVLTAVIAGLVGFVAGNAFFYLASPLWIDRKVSEALPPELMIRPVAAGAFAWAGISMPPALAAVLMSVSTIVVALNAQLLRRVALRPPVLDEPAPRPATEAVSR